MQLFYFLNKGKMGFLNMEQYSNLYSHGAICVSNQHASYNSTRQLQDNLNIQLQLSMHESKLPGVCYVQSRYACLVFCGV